MIEQINPRRTRGTLSLVEDMSPVNVKAGLEYEASRLKEEGLLAPTEVWIGNAEERRKGTIKLLVVTKELSADKDTVESGLILTSSGRLWNVPVVDGLYDGSKALEVDDEQYVESKDDVTKAVRLARELKAARDRRGSVISVNLMNGEYSRDFKRLRNSTNSTVRSLFSLIPGLEQQRLLRELPVVDFNIPELFADELDYQDAVERDAFSYAVRKGDTRVFFVVRPARQSYMAEKYHITAGVVTGRENDEEAISVTFGENGRLLKGREWDGSDVNATLNRREFSSSSSSRMLESILESVVSAAREANHLPLTYIHTKSEPVSIS